jgi:fumarate hydratase class II
MPEGTYQVYRVEHDTMGEVRLPGEALWPAQAQRRGELS